MLSSTRFRPSTVPLRWGLQAGRSSTVMSRRSNAEVTVRDRKSLPRSTRNRPPIGPQGSSRRTAERSAASTDSRDGSPGVSATPVIAFVAHSVCPVNQVIHGLRAWPSTSTSTAAWTWSVSHT